MRLLSAQLRNYRIHRELDVVFDRERSLIGGPNESGKSTLVEAVHRALFLKAKGQTEFHRSMISPTHGGEPSVELVFEARGQTWTVKKRFSGKGSTTLARSSGEPLTGEQAETELAALLGVTGGTTGKSFQAQWEHLWVWQGSACSDPSRYATALKESLVQRVQSLGAATLLQSELDSNLAKHFAEARSAIFTTQEKPKAGSDLDGAERAVADARLARNEAAERLGRLDAAAQAFEAAEGELPRVTETLRLLEEEQVQFEARSMRLAELQRQQTIAAQDAKGLEERWTAKRSADARIHKLDASIRKREATLLPVREAADKAAEAARGLNEAARDSERRHEAACETSRQARLHFDLAQAHRRVFELQAEVTALEARRDKLRGFQAARVELEKLRNELPRLSETQLRKIEKLDAEREKAAAAVALVAAEIEVLTTDLSIRVNDQSLAAGDSMRVVNDAVLRVGDGVEIRIRPGGGGTLSEARQRVSETEKELRQALDAHALKSVAAAIEACAQRRQADAKIETADAQIAALDPEELESSLARQTEQRSAAQTRLGRLMELAPEFAVAKDYPGSVAMARASEDAARLAEDAEKTEKAARDAAISKAQTAETAKARQQEEWERENRELEAQRVELRLSIASEGTLEQRAESILAAEADWSAAKAQLGVLVSQIAELQPELVEFDRGRIKRALEMARQRWSELQNGIAAGAALLRSDGGDDPRSALVHAEERLVAAEEELRRVTLKANAISLLHRCFQEEQQGLAKQFTRPLAEKISGYLQCLFGSTAEAAVELTEEGFTGLKISRGAGATDTWGFDGLSGGAQEQTAAAVRLAMAEVLAAEHDACLPVVFDDAFAYSDPERVKRLQRMLDLAAGRGLQVVILTCNPDDYAALGARQIALSRPESR